MLRSQIEDSSRDDNLNIRERFDDIAIWENSFTFNEDCTKLLVESIDEVFRSSNQRSTSITDCFAWTTFTPSESVLAESEIAYIEFPVSIRGEVCIGEGSIVTFVICSSQKQFSSVLSLWVVGEPYTEYRVGDKSLRENVIPDLVLKQ